MQSDPLSDILVLLEAHSLVTNGLHAGGDWAFSCPAPEGLKFVVVVEGRAWIRSANTEPLRLGPGDVLLLNGSSPYVLASDPDVEPVDAALIFQDSPDGIGRHGETPDVLMLGGRVLLDRARGDLLLDVLPPLVHVPAERADAETVRWLVARLDAELARGRPGASLAATQFAQLIVIHIIRAHLEAGGAAVSGWLRGLADRRLAPALDLLHREPARGWRLDELARAVGMSRTAFAVRFREVTGMTPLAYLARWRMHLADRALRTGGRTVAEIGHMLGYASESAFGAAFKREMGVPPRASLKLSRAG